MYLQYLNIFISFYNFISNFQIKTVILDPTSVDRIARGKGLNNNSLPRKKPFVSYYFQDWEPVVLKENNRTAEKNERRLKIHATLRIDSCNNLYCVLSPSLSLSFSFRHFLRLSLSTNIHVHSNVHTPYTFPFFSMDPLSVYLPLYAPTIFKCNVPRL